MQGKKILVLDDEETILQLLQEYFSDFGVDSTAFSEPVQALERIKQQEFDVILSDIHMPVMTGNNFAAEAVKICPDTPIILMTGKPSLDHSIEALKTGVFDFLLKPFHFEEARMAITKALKYRQLKMENLNYQNHLEELVEKRTKELSDFLFHSVQSLSFALEARDPYTRGHGQHVANTVITIAKRLGIESSNFQSLRLAAQLHDIGKIGIADSILLKPGKLTSEEYATMKEHVAIGYRILSPIPSLKEVSRYVYEHHERFDGNGYPRGLKGDEIHVHSRILLTAEILDALATERCYKPAWSQIQIEEFIKNESGKIFDPEIANAAIACINEYGRDFLTNPYQSVGLQQAASA